MFNPSDPDGTIAALAALGNPAVAAPLPVPPLPLPMPMPMHNDGGMSVAGGCVGGFLLGPPPVDMAISSAAEEEDDDDEADGGDVGGGTGSSSHSHSHSSSAAADRAEDGTTPRPKKRRRRVRSRFRKMSPHLESVYESLASVQRTRDGAAANVVEARRRVEEATRFVEEAVAFEAATIQAVADAEGAVVDAELQEPGGKWNLMYAKLLAYRERHGNCLVPQRSGETDPEMRNLAVWVQAQRLNYARPKEDGKSLKNKAWQIVALERIGFVWSALETSWEVHFDELVRFKEQNGHCNVPHGYVSETRNLASWLTVQRSLYRSRQLGKKTHLLPERERRLEELGLVWNVTEDAWMQKYRELEAYKAKHGHTRLTAKKGDPLFPLTQWTRKQRAQYKEVKRGKKNPLTEERIKKLEEVGMHLESSDDRWHAKYRELVSHREEHGNLSVPRGGKIERWVQNQRKEYKLLQEGIFSPMTAERVELLEKIGFVWGLGTRSG